MVLSRSRQSGRRPSRSPRPQRGPRPKFSRPHLETLEDRTLLSVDLSGFAQQLHDQLGSLQHSIDTALDAASQVPFLNKQLGEISNARVFTDNLLTTLQNTLSSITDSSMVQQDLFNLLGPGAPPPLRLLAAHDGSGATPTMNDVNFSGDDNGFEVDMRLHQGLVSAATPFNLNLGLPGVPFKVMSSGTVNIQVGFDYELAFKFTPGSSSPFSVDTTKVLQGGPGKGHEMSLNVTASLSPPNPTNPPPPPFSATVIIGFLEGQVADHVVNNVGQTSMNLAFNLDGLDPTSPDISSLTAGVSGNANLDLDLTGRFRDGNNMVSTAFPSIKTEFDLKWGFDTSNASDPVNVPEVDFNNVQLQLGSFLSNLLLPILNDIQEVTQPLQPVINALKAPIPGISDLSNAVGLGNVSLESLAKDIGPETPYNSIITVVTTLVDIVDTINKITPADNANNIWVPLGSFKIGGPDSQNGDLRNLTSGDPTQGLANLSKLIPVDLSGVLNSIDKELQNFSGPAADDAKQALDQLTNPNGISFKFPLFQDPAHSAFLLLLGQDAPFITFDAHYHFDDVDSQDYGYAGLVVNFTGKIHLDLNLSMGYDTFGIREFLNDPNKQATDFLDGLFIDNSPDPNNNNLPMTHIQFAGSLSAGVGVGIPDLVSVTVNGGVTTKDKDGNLGGPLSITLAGAGADNKLRASGIASDLMNFPRCIFNTTGEIDGSIFIDFKVGVDLPIVGFVGYENQFPLASGTLIDFNSHTQCNPMTPPPPPVLAGVNNGQLTLFTGPNAGMRQNVDDMSMGHETFEVSDHGTDSSGKEIVGVTAFGYTQMLSGVTSILSDGEGDASDTITVDQGVTSDATIYGSEGDDRLTYLGSGHAHLFGRAGNDQLTVGPQSQTSDLHGGGGNDVLKGGGGADTLDGDGGANDSDTLIAGPGDGQTLNGGQGSNHFYAGAGSSTMNGGPGTNVFTWQAGYPLPGGQGFVPVNGSILVNGMGSQNLLEVDDNSGHADAIAVSNLNGHLIALFNGTQVIDAVDVQQLNLETKTSPDAVTVNDLSSTSVKFVVMNYVGEASSADNVLQTYTLNGPSGAKTVNVTESTGSGMVTQTMNGQTVTKSASGTVTEVTGLGPIFLVANPDDKLVVSPGDGDTTVNVTTTTQRGTLEIDGGVGTDVYNVQSVSGPTTIIAQGGQNTFNVGSKAPATGGVLSGIKAALTLRGSGGNDTANVDDTGASVGQEGTLTDKQLTGLDMATGGSITYNGLSALNVSLGAGADKFHNTGLATGTVTTVDGGPGSDTFDGNYAGDFDGTLYVKAFEQITMLVGGNFNGFFSASGPGNVQSFVIDGSVSATGQIYGDNVTTMTVGNGAPGDVAGTVQFTNTISQMTVFGSVTATGFISAGTIQNLHVYGDVAGEVLATNTDTIGTMQVDGSITVTGSVISYGTIQSLTVGHDVAGLVEALGTITFLSVGGSVTSSGQVFAGGDITTALVTGDVAGLVEAQGNITSISVGGSVTGTGSVIAGVNLVTALVTGDVAGLVEAVLGSITFLSVGGSVTVTGRVIAGLDLTTAVVGADLAGQILVGRNLGLLTVGGSVTYTGLVSVGGDLTEMTVGPDTYSPGHDMAGRIVVGGTLGDLRVAGGTPGTVVAGHVGTVRVYGGYGPVVMQIKEAGVQRRVEAAVPGNPYPLPAPPPAPTTPASPAGVVFQYVYESGALANPQLTARVTNTASTAPDQFDLSLVVWSDTAKFNLARLDAVGTSGIRNIAVEGNVLTAVSPSTAGFFKVPGGVDADPAGVYLPADALAGVAVRDNVTAGAVQAASVQAVAFGSLTDSFGTTPGASANQVEAREVPSATTAVLQANDTFRVPFADALPVAFFLDTQASNHQFDSQEVLFTDQAANDLRGAVTALVTVTVPLNPGGQPGHSTIQTVALRGDGGAIQTAQPITQAISSTGPLGDLNLWAAGGLGANVTAPSIIGSILVQGPIAGIVQTTGLRTEPTTGQVAPIPADFGRVVTVMTPTGPVLTTTTVQAQGGGITGELVSRGNFISQVTANSGISGVIAAQGDIGALVGTTRLGGLLSHGPLRGEIVTLGRILGDMEIDGGLQDSPFVMQGGRIAARGGIVGNLVLKGAVDGGSAIVSGGEIGDATEGTALTVGSVQGILAAEGPIALARGVTQQAAFYQGNIAPGSSNAAVIDAVFSPSAFDLSGQDLGGLNLILQHLLALKGSGGALTM